MPISTIYLIRAYTGSHDDARCWSVASYKDPHKAEEHRRLAQAAADEVLERKRRHGDYEQANEPTRYDLNCTIDCSIYYAVEPVLFVEGELNTEGLFAAVTAESAATRALTATLDKQAPGSFGDKLQAALKR